MAVTNEGLRGLEGQAARLYFDAFGRMILTEDKAFRFEGRNRRPPRDRCNAMENLIGVSCNDNMTERLRLLCLLFDFSRKEGE